MSRVLVLSAHGHHVDRRIVSEVNALASSGRKVTLLSVPTRKPETDLDPAVRLIRPGTPPDPGMRALRDLALRLPAGFRETLRAVRTLPPWNPLKRLRDFFLRHAPDDHFDAIHCHDLVTLPAALVLRRYRWPRARVIYDSHEFYAFQSPNRHFQTYWSGVEALHIDRVDRVVTVNEAIANELARLYRIPRPAVVYNSYGIARDGRPIDDRAWVDLFGPGTSDFRVIFQGGLGPERNLETLVAAFADLRGVADLHFLGEGPFEKRLRELARARRLDNVHFGGWRSQTELLPILAAAHLGIIPYSPGVSMNHRLCTPNKLYEFVEARLPICTNDLPEIRKVVERFGNGLVRTMRDAGDIARAIAEARAGVRNGEYPASARESARRALSWDAQARVLLAIYDDLRV